MQTNPQDLARERMFENAALLWQTNFAGEARTFNAAGQQNFVLGLTQEQADELVDLGYNVKMSKERTTDEGETIGGQLYLQVDLEWKFKPSRIIMIGQTSRKETQLDQEGAGILDDMEIVSADIVIRPYDYNVNGKEGTSAKLKSGYFTIYEDYLELKYAALRGDIEPDVAQAAHP